MSHGTRMHGQLLALAEQDRHLQRLRPSVADVMPMQHRPRHELHPVDRVILSYNRHVQLHQELVDAGHDQHWEYQRGMVDGLGRAIFDLTGQWPHQLRDPLPRPRSFPRDGL